MYILPVNEGDEFVCFYIPPNTSFGPILKPYIMIGEFEHTGVIAMIPTPKPVQEKTGQQVWLAINLCEYTMFARLDVGKISEVAPKEHTTFAQMSSNQASSSTDGA